MAEPVSGRDAAFAASLIASLDGLRAQRADRGTLDTIVVRPAEDERLLPASAELTREDGVAGDAWRATRTRMLDDGGLDPGNQLTLISTALLGLIAERERWPLAGDQLIVDLALDFERLPVGAQLAIGDEAVVEISAEPHTGCAKFSARFGSEALRFINSPDGRALRLRGVNAMVVTPGRITVGDPITRL